MKIVSRDILIIKNKVVVNTEGVYEKLILCTQTK